MFKCIQVFPLAGHLGSTLFCSNRFSINMLISRYVHPCTTKDRFPEEKLPKLMYFKSSHIYYQNTLQRNIRSIYTPISSTEAFSPYVHITLSIFSFASLIGKKWYLVYSFNFFSYQRDLSYSVISYFFHL